MPKNIHLKRWCAAAPDYRIGIRYRVVQLAMGHRKIVVYNKRSLQLARRAAVRVADELLDVCAADEPVKPLADDTGLRVLLGDEPVDFVIEEDTFDGDPD